MEFMKTAHVHNPDRVYPDGITDNNSLCRLESQ